MKTLAHQIKQLIHQRLDDATPGEVLTIASHLTSVDSANAAAMDAPISRDNLPRFVKMGASGEPVTSPTAEWVAVYDRQQNLTFTRGSVVAGRLSFAKANEVAKQIIMLNHSDWRLPTPHELFAIADLTRHEPAIDTDYFDCESAAYWTQTVLASSPSGFAWGVDFNAGVVGWSSQSSGCFVRAVRVGQY
jgi:hypothetical protein